MSEGAASQEVEPLAKWEAYQAQFAADWEKREAAIQAAHKAEIAAIEEEQKRIEALCPGRRRNNELGMLHAREMECKKHGEILAKYKNRDDREERLRLAATEGLLQDCRSLLKAGAMVNAKGRQGRTPLHCAAAAGEQDVVRLLVDAHAHPEAKAEYGVTSRELAMEQGHMQVVETLTACSPQTFSPPPSPSTYYKVHTAELGDHGDHGDHRPSPGDTWIDNATGTRVNVRQVHHDAAEENPDHIAYAYTVQMPDGRQKRVDLDDLTPTMDPSSPVPISSPLAYTRRDLSSSPTGEPFTIFDKTSRSYSKSPSK